MKIFPKPLFMKQILYLKLLVILLLFTGSLFCEIQKHFSSLKVVGTKVYDKDGAVDILLQHSTTGVIKIIYLNIYGTQLS